VALPIRYNIRNLRVRWQVTLLAIFGISLVVTVFVVLLSMAAGFQLALRATGRTDNVVLSQRGSGSELTSWTNRSLIPLVTVDSRVARGSDGQPLVSTEMVVVANLPKKGSGAPTNVTVRGVTAKTFEVRGGIKIKEGRNFTPGLSEIIVGERVRDRMQGLDVGDKVKIQRRDWEVVGVFSADGGAFESEIWGDYEIMGPAFLRGGGANSVVMRVSDPATIPAFALAVKDNPQLQHELKEERQYYEDQSGVVARPLLALAGFVSIVMGIGAVFGAMNTMYAIVAARTREIGTLRALGFSRASILTGFMIESLLLALAGGVLGCLLSFTMNGYQAATAQATFSEIAFAFKVTGSNVLTGIVFALAMGFLGGLVPAFRAARLPIVNALREG
jgi:putative ABC transport system permease protein